LREQKERLAATFLYVRLIKKTKRKREEVGMEAKEWNNKEGDCPEKLLALIIDEKPCLHRGLSA
jgi:hypothetical protein